MEIAGAGQMKRPLKDDQAMTENGWLHYLQWGSPARFPVATRCFGLLILGASPISSQSLVDESEAVSEFLLKTVTHHDRGRLKALVLVRVPWSRVWGVFPVKR